jgi:hypothetical protein
VTQYCGVDIAGTFMDFGLACCAHELIAKPASASSACGRRPGSSTVSRSNRRSGKRDAPATNGVSARRIDEPTDEDDLRAVAVEEPFDSVDVFAADQRRLLPTMGVYPPVGRRPGPRLG